MTVQSCCASHHNVGEQVELGEEISLIRALKSEILAHRSWDQHETDPGTVLEKLVRDSRDILSLK